jgi:hypothetical protein
MAEKMHEDVAKDVSRQQQVEVAGTLNGGARLQVEYNGSLIKIVVTPQTMYNALLKKYVYSYTG